MQKARIIGRKEGWMRVSPFRLAPLLLLAFLYLGLGSATSLALTLPAELAISDCGSEPPDSPSGFGAILESAGDDVLRLGVRHSYLDHLQFCGPIASVS